MQGELAFLIVYSKAVLVAISIPVFGSKVEAAREATDASNLRAAYAAAQAECLTNSAFSGGYYQKDGSFADSTTNAVKGTAKEAGLKMTAPTWDITIFPASWDNVTSKYIKVTVEGTTTQVTKVEFDE